MRVKVPGDDALLTPGIMLFPVKLVQAPEPSAATTAVPSSPPAATPSEKANANDNTALVLAIVGILGTLAATIITQWLTSRRENKKREWDREQEAVRWERERKERQDQWRREDAARLFQERLLRYTELLASVREVLRATRTTQGLMALDNLLKSPEVNQRAHEVNQRAHAQLREPIMALRHNVAAVSIVGSPNVRLHSAGILKVADVLSSSSLINPFIEVEPSEYRETIRESGESLLELQQQLEDSIRRDVGSAETAMQ